MIDYKEVVREAFFALCEYQSPALTKRQQEERLGRCWELLATAVRGPYQDGNEDEVSGVQA